MAPFSTTVAQVAFWRQPSKVNKKNLAGDNADSGGAWRPVFLGQVAEVGAAWAIAADPCRHPTASVTAAKARQTALEPLPAFFALSLI